MAKNCTDLISQPEYGLEGCSFSHVNSNGNCVFSCGGAFVVHTPNAPISELPIRGVTVKAPIGHHFMLKGKDYYLMKTMGRYKAYVHEGYVSRLSIKIQTDKVHTASAVKGTKKGARH